MLPTRRVRMVRDADDEPTNKKTHYIVDYGVRSRFQVRAAALGKEKPAADQAKPRTAQSSRMALAGPLGRFSCSRPGRKISSPT